MKKRLLKILAICSLPLLGLTLMSTGENRFFALSKNLEIYCNAYRAVIEEHAEGADPSRLMRIGMDAMLKSRDPYTNFISEAEMEGYRFLENPNKVGSIGATLAKKDKSLVLDIVYEGFAAQKAGLRPGDVLIEVDGDDVTDKSQEEVDMLIKSAIGSEMNFKFKREGKADLISVKLKMEAVEPKNVPYFGMVSDDIGYVVLTIFTQNAGSNVADAVRDMKSKHPNMKGLILDLRDNGGGLLMEAVDLLNVFVPKNVEVVTIKSKVAEWDKSFRTQGEPVDLDLPVAVLINAHSASASEITCGNIQDLDRGVLVGQRSFGKGLVQNTRDLPYNSKVKITTAKYYIPSGRCIQAVRYDAKGQPVELEDALKTAFKTKNGRTVYDGGGVQPDLKVELEPETPLVKALNEQRVIFDFATIYRNNHDSIAKPREFALTDKDYQDFMTYLKKINFRYESESGKALKKLEDVTKTEHYYQAVNVTLATIANKFEAQKQKDLISSKARIIRDLETEIVGRYYYEGGTAEARLKRDPEVQEAVKLLLDTKRYQAYLAPK